MFRKGGLVFFGLAATVPLLLQLAGVAKAFDGIVVTPGQIQPVAEFSCGPKTNTGCQAVLYSPNSQLLARTYGMVRNIQHGWVLQDDALPVVMALRFNGKPIRDHVADVPTRNSYEWIDSTQVQVEFVGEKRVVPPPTNPQQAQQQGGNPQHQYPLYTVSEEASLPSPIFKIVVRISLKPLVGHRGGVVTTVGNHPKIVGHFTWAAAAEGAHDGMVKVTSTSDSLQSRSYKVTFDSKHGWVLQDPAVSSEIHVLRPDGELYRERMGGGVQHTGPGGRGGDAEVIGTYQWDREKNKEVSEGELYVKVSFDGEKENPQAGEHDADPTYKVVAMESTPGRWHINVSFTLKPNDPPADRQMGVVRALAALIIGQNQDQP